MTKFKINYPIQNEVDIGIIPFFDKCNLIVSHTYADIFSLIGRDPKQEATNFTSKFENNDVFYPYYMLIDMLKHEPIRTVFCLRETHNGFKITKGAKKLVAMSANNLTMADIIIVGTKNYGTKINNDDELYDIVKRLDPTVETVKCELIEPLAPCIHVLENINNVKVWRSRQDSNLRPQR